MFVAQAPQPAPPAPTAVTAAVWQSYIDRLEKTDLSQKVDGTRVHCASFVPALSPRFAEHVLEPSDVVTVAQAVASLSELAPMVGSDADEDVDELVRIVSKATCAEHLVVQLIHIYTRETFFYRSLKIITCGKIPTRCV